MSFIFSDIDNDLTKVVPTPIALTPAVYLPPWLQGAYLGSDVGLGQTAPCFFRSGTRPQWLQGCLGWNGSTFIVPSVGSNAPTGMGCSVVPVGVFSHPALSTGSLVNSTRRSRVTTNPGPSHAVAMFTGQTLVWRGSGGAGQGGFYVCSRFVLRMTPADGNYGFVGLVANTAITGSAPSSVVDMVGLGAEVFSGTPDSVFQMYCNDSSGTASRTPLPSSFPTPASGTGSGNTQLLQMELFCAPSGATIYYRVMRLDDTTIAPAVGTLTTNLPTNTAFLSFIAYANTGTGDNAILEHVRTYLECDV